MTEQDPSRGLDPADFDGSLPGLMRFAFQKMAQRQEGMLPAKVVAYDRKANRVKLEIMTNVVGTDGSVTKRAEIASVPVHRFGGGGLVISAPLNPGDVGWVFAGDRDTSLVQQGDFAKDAAPNTDRTHSFADGLFLPDSAPQYDPQAGEEGALTIGTRDGSFRIVMGADGKAKIFGVALDITGPVTIDGDLTVSGSVTGMGGVKLETHRHKDVQPGGGNSGEPIP